MFTKLKLLAIFCLAIGVYNGYAAPTAELKPISAMCLTSYLTKNSQDANDNVCAGDEFACNDGSCIKNEQKCDGIRNCRDSEDETDCGDDHFLCEHGEFKCKSEDKCIPVDKLCDGFLKIECSDKSDQTSCNFCEEDDMEKCQPNPICPFGFWPCRKNNKCIPIEKRCDGYQDCTSRSDETINCGRDRGGCRGGAFECADGIECAFPDAKCDYYGRDDCADGSDQIGCPPA